MQSKPRNREVTIWLIVQWALSINTSRLVCPAYLNLDSIDFILSHKTILDSHIQRGSCAKDSNRRIRCLACICGHAVICCYVEFPMTGNRNRGIEEVIYRLLAHQDTL